MFIATISGECLFAGLSPFHETNNKRRVMDLKYKYVTRYHAYRLPRIPLSSSSIYVIILEYVKK